MLSFSLIIAIYWIGEPKVEIMRRFERRNISQPWKEAHLGVEKLFFFQERGEKKKEKWKINFRSDEESKENLFWIICLRTRWLLSENFNNLSEIINLSIFISNFPHSSKEKQDDEENCPSRFSNFLENFSLVEVIIYTSWVLLSPWPASSPVLLSGESNCEAKYYLFRNIICGRARVICINVLDFIKCFERFSDSHRPQMKIISRKLFFVSCFFRCFV